MNWISRFAEAILLELPTPKFNSNPAGIKLVYSTYHILDPATGRPIQTELNRVGHEAKVLELRMGLCSFFSERGLDDHDVYSLFYKHSAKVQKRSVTHDYLDSFDIVGYGIDSFLVWGTKLTALAVEWHSSRVVYRNAYFGSFSYYIPVNFICEANCSHVGYIHIVVADGRITKIWNQIGFCLGTSGDSGSLNDFSDHIREISSNSMDILIDYPQLLALIMDL